jgi:hypothetical protein
MSRSAAGRSLAGIEVRLRVSGEKMANPVVSNGPVASALDLEGERLLAGPAQQHHVPGAGMMDQPHQIPGDLLPVGMILAEHGCGVLGQTVKDPVPGERERALVAPAHHHPGNPALHRQHLGQPGQHRALVPDGEVHEPQRTLIDHLHGAVGGAVRTGAGRARRRRGEVAQPGGQGLGQALRPRLPGNGREGQEGWHGALFPHDAAHPVVDPGHRVRQRLAPLSIEGHHLFQAMVRVDPDLVIARGGVVGGFGHALDGAIDAPEHEAGGAGLGTAAVGVLVEAREVEVDHGKPALGVDAHPRGDELAKRPAHQHPKGHIVKITPEIAEIDAALDPVAHRHRGDKDQRAQHADKAPAVPDQNPRDPQPPPQPVPVPGLLGRHAEMGLPRPAGEDARPGGTAGQEPHVVPAQFDLEAGHRLAVAHLPDLAGLGVEEAEGGHRARDAVEELGLRARSAAGEPGIHGAELVAFVVYEPAQKRHGAVGERAAEGGSPQTVDLNEHETGFIGILPGRGVPQQTRTPSAAAEQPPGAAIENLKTVEHRDSVS